MKKLVAVLLIAQAMPLMANEIVSELRAPEGFTIEALVTGLDGARSMDFADDTTLIVTTRFAKDRVYRVSDVFTSPSVEVITSDYKIPNGVVVDGDDLYIASLGAVHRFPGGALASELPPAELVRQDPDGRKVLHGWPYAAMGPDGEIYFSDGVPCNICAESKYGTILRVNPQTGEETVVARGVRNSVGFDWHPETGDLWFTNNGRDMLGDDIPPDSLNRLNSEGDHFGFPYCHSGVPDPEFGAEKPCSDFEPAVQKLVAHAGALGMVFTHESNFPEGWNNGVIVAEHGSWNRSTKVGYRLTYVALDGNDAVDYRPFVEGWLKSENEVLGRPVDLEWAPDGSLLISDDESGTIYRLTYPGS